MHIKPNFQENIFGLTAGYNGNWLQGDVTKAKKKTLPEQAGRGELREIGIKSLHVCRTELQSGSSHCSSRVYLLEKTTGGLFWTQEPSVISPQLHCSHEHVNVLTACWMNDPFAFCSAVKVFSRLRCGTCGQRRCRTSLQNNWGLDLCSSQDFSSTCTGSLCSTNHRQSSAVFPPVARWQIFVPDVVIPSPAKNVGQMLTKRRDRLLQLRPH